MSTASTIVVIVVAVIFLGFFIKLLKTPIKLALKLLLQTAEDTRADIVRGGYELLRQRPDGTFAEQPHPAGRPSTIALGRGGSYGAFLENSGPQFSSIFSDM